MLKRASRAPVITGAAIIVIAAVPLVGCSKGRSRSGAVRSSGAVTAAATSSTSGPGAGTAGSTAGSTGGTTGSSGGSGSTAPGTPSSTPGSTPGGTPGSTPSSTPSSTPPAPPAPSTPPAPTTPAPGSPITDLDGPVITITSPARGEFVSGVTATVTGNVQDATGVALMTVNNLVVAVDPTTGDFTHTASLEVGMNTLAFRAADVLGNSSDIALSVLAGEFRPLGEKVEDALVARINEPVFDTLEPLIASQVTGAQMSALVLAQNPLFQRRFQLFGITLADITVSATHANFGNPTIDLDPTSAGLETTVVIPNVDIGLQARNTAGIRFTLNGGMTADSIDVGATANIAVAAGQYTLDVTNVDVTLQNFNWDIRGLPGFIERLLRGVLRGQIESLAEDLIRNDLPAAANSALQSITQPQQFNALGTTITAEFEPTAIDFDDDGATIVVDANVTVPPGPNAFAAPGSLKTSSLRPSLPTTPGISFSINDDLANRITHAAWRAGMMDVAVDGSQLPSAAGGALGLNSTVLAFLFPQLIGQIPFGQNVELRLTPMLPPVAKVTGSPDLVELQLGDMLIDFYVDDGQGGQIHVLQVAIQLAAGATPLLNNNVVTVAVVGTPTLVADIVLEPVADLDDAAVENFLRFIVPPAIQIGATLWSGAPIPALPGVTLSNVAIHQDGSSGDFITLEGDIR